MILLWFNFILVSGIIILVTPYPLITLPFALSLDYLSDYWFGYWTYSFYSEGEGRFGVSVGSMLWPMSEVDGSFTFGIYTLGGSTWEGF